MHPAADVPVTVYVPEAAGVNATPFDTTGDQEYVVAPEAVNVTVWLVHIATSAPPFTVGSGFTVTKT
jgi:hypothetical protein